MKRMKLAAVFVLLLLAALFAAGCGGKDAEFEVSFRADAPAVIELGQSIDMDDYVVPVTAEGAQTQYSAKYITDGADEDIAIEGRVFVPQKAGQYELHYTVTVGKTTKSAEPFVLTVEAAPVTLQVDQGPVIFRKGEKINLDVLIARVSATAVPVDAELTLTKAEYTRKEISAAQTVKESATIDLTGLDSYTFEKAGDYMFTCRASKSGRYAEQEFRVAVVDPDTVPDHLKGENNVSNAEFGDDGWVRLIKNGTRSMVSYAVLGNYKEGARIGIEFSGKNLPQIGFLCTTDETNAEPNGLYAGSGFVLSFEYNSTDKYFVWGPEKLRSNALKTGVAERDELFGYEDLEEGKRYYLEAGIDVAENSGSGFVSWSFYEIGADGGRLVKQLLRSGWSDASAAIPKEGKLVLYGSVYNDVVCKVFAPDAEPVKDGDVSYDEEGERIVWSAFDGAKGYFINFGAGEAAFAAANSYDMPFGDYQRDFSDVHVYAITDTGMVFASSGSVSVPGRIIASGSTDETDFSRNYVKLNKAAWADNDYTDSGYLAFNQDFEAGMFVRVEFNKNQSLFPPIFAFFMDGLTSNPGKTNTDTKGILLSADIPANGFQVWGPGLYDGKTTASIILENSIALTPNGYSDIRAGENFSKFIFYAGIDREDEANVYTARAIGFWEDTSGTQHLIADCSASFEMEGVPEKGRIVLYASRNEAISFVFSEPAPLAAGVSGLRTEGRTVSWDAVSGAEGYIVSVNGVSEIVTQTSYEVPSSPYDQTLNISVCAVIGGAPTSAAYTEMENTGYVKTYKAQGLDLSASKVKLPMNADGTAYSDQSYLGFDIDYAPGTYVRADTAGNGLPMFGFFMDELSGSIGASGTAKGLLVSGDIPANGLQLWGPSMFDGNISSEIKVPDSAAATSTGIDAIRKQSDFSKFIYIVGVNGGGGSYTLDVRLYWQDKSGAAHTVFEDTYGFEMDGLPESGRIALFGSRLAIVDIVRFYLPASLAELTEGLNITD